jgi:hypothetical protein
MLHVRQNRLWTRVTLFRSWRQTIRNHELPTRIASFLWMAVAGTALVNITSYHVSDIVPNIAVRIPPRTTNSLVAACSSTLSTWAISCAQGKNDSIKILIPLDKF